MHVEMAKKSSFIIVTPINNGEMYLKINFRRYCFLSCYEIFFNLIWILFEGLNKVNPQFLVISNMFVSYHPISKKIQFSTQNLSVSNATPIEMSHFDLKISKNFKSITIRHACWKWLKRHVLSS